MLKINQFFIAVTIGQGRQTAAQDVFFSISAFYFNTKKIKTYNSGLTRIDSDFAYSWLFFFTNNTTILNNCVLWNTIL